MPQAMADRKIPQIFTKKRVIRLPRQVMRFAVTSQWFGAEMPETTIGCCMIALTFIFSTNRIFGNIR